MRGELGAIVVGLGRCDGGVYWVRDAREVLEQVCDLAGFPA